MDRSGHAGGHARRLLSYINLYARSQPSRLACRMDARSQRAVAQLVSATDLPSYHTQSADPTADLGEIHNHYYSQPLEVGFTRHATCSLMRWRWRHAGWLRSGLRLHRLPTDAGGAAHVLLPLHRGRPRRGGGPAAGRHAAEGHEGDAAVGRGRDGGQPDAAVGQDRRELDDHRGGPPDAGGV